MPMPFASKALLLLVVATRVSQPLEVVSTYIRVPYNVNPTDNGTVHPAMSWSMCSAKCHTTRCKVWSWAPEENWCSFHQLSTSFSTTYVPPSDFRTYLALVSLEDDIYLVLNAGSQTWNQARDRCPTVGGVLAYHEDIVWLKSVRDSYGVNGFFLGLLRDSNDIWHDLQGQVIENSTISWSAGEPTLGTQKCTAIFGMINDINCNSPYPLPSLCKLTRQ